MKKFPEGPTPLDHPRFVWDRRGFQTMLILRGSPALSSFRLQKRLATLTGAGLPIRRLSADYVHVVETEGDLSPDQAQILAQLLTYGPAP